MATSRKGSTTPKELKEDAGGLVAGGGPDLSGTASQPAQPDVSKTRARASGPATGSKKAATGQQPDSAPAPKARPKGAKTGTPGSSAVAQAAAAGTAAGPGQDEAQRSAGGILPPAAGAQAADPDGRMSDEERQRRIAERAYRKAQERGFAGDRQLDDWLEAEREHNAAERRSS